MRRALLAATAVLAALAPYAAALAQSSFTTMTAVDVVSNAVETYAAGKFTGTVGLQPTNEIDIRPPFLAGSQIASSTGGTFEAWVYVPSALPSTVQFIFGDIPSRIGATGYVAETATGALEFVSGGVTSYFYTPVAGQPSVYATTTPVSATSPVSAGWHHIALAFAPGVTSPLPLPVFYVDGTSVPVSGYLNVPGGSGFFGYGQLPAGSTISSQYSPGPFQALSIGSLADPSSGAVPVTFAGTISELALWSGAHYSANFTPPTVAYQGTETGLVGLFHLNGSLAPSGPSFTATCATKTSGAFFANPNCPRH